MSSQGKEEAKKTAEATVSLEKIDHGAVDDEKEEVDDENELLPTQERKLAAEYLLKNKEPFTSKWVLKNMPTTARNLQNGSLSVSDFMGDVNFMARDLCDEKSTRNIFTLNTTDAVKIALAAIPVRFARNAGMTLEAYRSLTEDFAVSVAERIDIVESKSPTGLIYWSETYQEIVDQVIEKEADAMDKALFRGKKNTFLRKCPLYKKPDRFFFDLLGGNCDEIRAKRASFFFRLRDAAEKIAVGKNNPHKTCWECKKQASKMNRCSCCQVAQYCGKQCQRKAWKTGHQANCAQIKEKYDSVLESLDIVVALHEQQIRAGRTPSFQSDYNALSHSIDTAPGSNYWEGSELENTVSGPSIVHYFDNLRLVREGQLWFFPSPKTEKKKNKLRDGDTREQDTREMVLHVLIVMLLCYDYSGCRLQQEAGGRRIVPAYKCNHKLAELKRGTPVECFLEVYDQEGEFPGDEKEKAAIFKKHRTETMRSFLQAQLDEV